MAESKKFVPLKVAEPEYVNTNNPLRYLSVQQISMMLDSARSGRISQLQLLYSLVEQCQLTLSMCITRRQSALPDWAIKRRDTRRYRRFDEKLAQEQEAFLNDMFIRCEDSGTLLRAIDTLHMAVFRGIGVIEPIYDEYGLQKIVSLDPWNFAIDFSHHDEFGQYPLYWNPSGADVLDFKTELELIPEEQIVANFSASPIDSFGLQIFLAEQMGLESYSKLIARKGLPATYIVAPEDLPSENLETWAQRAVDCARGGSGALPFGTNIITEKIDSTNGQSIQDFLEYMAKQIVLASTGGTLTSLAQATGLGSNLADVQQDVFKTIVRHDAYKIGDLINRGIAKKLLNERFPDKPHLVYFDLSNESKESPEKYLQDAVTAKNAGLAIDLNQLQELTGFKLTKEELKENTSIWNVPRLNKKETTDEWKPEAPLNTLQALVTGGEAVEVVNNTQEQTEGTTSASGDDRDVKHGVSILKAFNKVLQPIRELFYKLFDAKTRDESRQIAEEIDAKIKEIEESDDNELVKAVTQLMVDGFEDENAVIGKPDESVTQNYGTSEGAKKGWATRLKNGWTPKEVAKKSKAVGELARRALSDRQSQETLNLGTISGSAVADIKDVTGIDVTGFEHTISSNDIRHADKRHGQPRNVGKRKLGEQDKGQVPLDAADFERIPELFADYDMIDAGSADKRTGNPSVRFIKEYPDGTLYGVEVIVEDDKQLTYKTGWKKKPKKP